MIDKRKTCGCRASADRDKRRQPEHMAHTFPKPKYVVNESGKASSVILTVADYERLLAAWEEVADSEDFATAKTTAKRLISADELRRRVTRPK